jgi:hypothetical protein
MRTEITYITKDGKKFDNQFSAKRHECELTEHNWEFYSKNGVLQKEQNELTHMRFCKYCGKQQAVNSMPEGGILWK